jgi:cytochrome c-type biogenesis protein CcmH/NrfF
LIGRALALAALAALLAAPPALAQEPRASLPDIEDEVMCPICGTPLEHSEAPQAERERELIRDLIAEGRTKEEIKDALVAEYGEEVLATPDDSGFDLAAWVLPALAILAAIGGIAAFVLRGGKRGDGTGESQPLEPAESTRLDEDMARYDR